MHSGVPLSEVTDAHCGVWIEGASVRNPIEFSVAIVDLAVSYGFEVEPTWDLDRPKFLSGDYSFDMLEDLSFVTDVALDYLNVNVADGYYFEFEDGLCLFRDTDLDEDDPA